MDIDAIYDSFQINNSEDLTPTLNRLSKIFGFDTASYLGLSVPNAKGQREAFGYSTYNLKWINKYAESNYKLVDPVVKAGIRRILPLDWIEVRHQNKFNTEFFLEAQAHGVGINGLSFPIRGSLGELSLFSINSNMSPREWLLFKKENIADLQMAAFFYHEKVLSLRAASESNPELSNREAEVVRWLALGKTQWEISVILNLSTSTVRYHVNNAKRKMKATNVAQTIANAISSNAIQL